MLLLIQGKGCLENFITKKVACLDVERSQVDKSLPKLQKITLNFRWLQVLNHEKRISHFPIEGRNEGTMYMLTFMRVNNVPNKKMELQLLVYGYPKR